MKRPIYNAIHSLFADPAHFCAAILYRINGLFPDKMYLKMIYRLECGKKLNLEHPTTFNEKMQWLKLYDHRPFYIELADKIKVKEHVAKLVGEEYVIPTLGVWDRVEDIEWDNLPNQFVLKTNHDSGSSGVVVCKDKSRFSQEKACQILQRSLQKDSSRESREWHYKHIERKVFAEQYMEDCTTKDLRDYKIYCFDGEVKFLFVATERQIPGEVAKFDYFDADFQPMDLKMVHPRSKNGVQKPKTWEVMKKVASQLSTGVPIVRMDMYEVDGRVYFGEYTFFPSSGLAPFHPDEWDEIFGEMIDITKINK